MAKFDDIIPLIKKHEGGLTGDPRDISAAANPSPCGIDKKYNKPYHTNKGVTYATFKGNAASSGYDASCDNFLKMPDDIWLKIFKNGYWNPMGLDNLNSKGISFLLVDFAWGSGVGGTKSWLTGFLKRNYNIAASNTTSRISELNNLISKNENDLINKLYEDRLSHLKSLRGGSLWTTYGKGWKRRLDELKNIASSSMTKITESVIAAKEVVKKNPYKSAALTLAIILLAFVGYKLIRKNK